LLRSRRLVSISYIVSDRKLFLEKARIVLTIDAFSRVLIIKIEDATQRHPSP
jgi:hypothetical protein